ncbi:MAG: arginine repressor [Limnochordia bacterium]|jgi:transcriptional regulator of arginine metabolism
MNRRHAVILKLIRDHVVATQEDLTALLAAQGIEVTQATVSRDIRELRLVKVPAGTGYRYAEPPEAPTSDAVGRARRAFNDFVRDIGVSRNFIILKCEPGTANAVAAAIDDIAYAAVMATLAGDDVVLIIVSDPDDQPPSQAVLALEAELHRLWGQEVN